MKHRVPNWPEYETGLRSRGGLTLWITPEALAQWQAPRRSAPGGQARYSDVAIETAPMLGCAFRMRLRQSEGLMGSIAALTTLSRRAQKPRPSVGPGCLMVHCTCCTGLKVFGAGQWLQEKQGAKSRRRWRKLHLAVDADSGQIVAHTLTDQNADDSSQGGIAARPDRGRDQSV